MRRRGGRREGSQLLNPTHMLAKVLISRSSTMSSTSRLLTLYGLGLNHAVYFHAGSSCSPGQRKTHTVHQMSHPAYPPRVKVKSIFWDEPDPDYRPVEFTHKAVLENDCTKKQNGWADPAEVTPEFQKKLAERTSNSIHEGDKVIMVNGLPRNPIGRTGMTGRGLLGKYGPNFAADPLVTRFDPNTGHLQMVAIQRGDTKQWAIPGGMVDEGETVSATLKREFTEEARNMKDEEQKEVQEKLDELFQKSGIPVYIGYVDDPRNTDIAWMETTCYHFHITDDYLANHLKLEAGDDASHARWLDVADDEPDFKNLYASHRDMVIKALLRDPNTFKSAIGKVAHL